MQTLNSVKKNRYKFRQGDHAWLVPENKREQCMQSPDSVQDKELVKVRKRLLRPFRESCNFYLCEHCEASHKFLKIHPEVEMVPLIDEGRMDIYQD